MARKNARKNKTSKTAQNAKKMADMVISRFESESVAAPLAKVMLLKGVDLPMMKWSYLNQLFCVLGGATDARGFNQWKAAGRMVQKGQKARSFIRIPCVAKDKKDPENRDKWTMYYKWLAVFDVAQTDGDELPHEKKANEHIDALPMIDVARKWGITVNGTIPNDSYYGQFAYTADGSNQRITLAVENIDTWLHELVHAAELQLGNLTVADGQQWDNETVATLGACVLSHMLGLSEHANEGSAYQYIQRYAESNKMSVSSACTKMIDRTCKAVAHIIDSQ